MQDEVRLTLILYAALLPPAVADAHAFPSLGVIREEQRDLELL